MPTGSPHGAGLAATRGQLERRAGKSGSTVDVPDPSVRVSSYRNGAAMGIRLGPGDRERLEAIVADRNSALIMGIYVQVITLLPSQARRAARAGDRNGPGNKTRG